MHYTHLEGFFYLKGNMKDINEYTLSNPPPKGHKDLAKWVWGLFEASYAEKERLGLMERWRSNYRLFRGNHWGGKARNKDKVTVNLYFANVQRTVANITAENPIAEVVDLDGNEDDVDKVLSLKMKKWWNETEQQGKLASSTLNNENYGITIEKAVWDNANQRFIPVIMDAYSYFPAPGYFADNHDMPYEIHAYAVPIHEIERTFNVKDIVADDVKSVLGREDREQVRPNIILADSGVGIVHEQKRDSLSTTDKQGEALVVECWMKDYSKRKVKTGEFDEETGKEILEEELIYPDGIRVVTVCNKHIFLNDMPNPNVNFNLEHDKVKTSFAWGRKAFYKINSYEDTTSIWGFSAAEQTGDLNKKINEIVSRMVAYVNRVLFPTLVIEKGAGITKSMINNKPGLVLMPTRPNARIEYLAVPNLPSNFFEILSVLTNFHDRIYQIEDADRGKSPTGVTAASAIVALQERNAVLIRHKIRGAEYLCRMRGRWNISFLQNFSIQPERLILSNDEPYEFTGVSLAGRKFNYVVESDSTIAKASAYSQEQAVGLFKLNAIDRTALLGILNVPDREMIIERMGETQLDEAFSVLIEAGLEEDQAIELKQYLMQPQTTPKEETRPTQTKPKAQQGGM